MKVAVLASGGKDSTFSLWISQQQYEVTSLITVLSEEDSMLYQHQSEKFAFAYAEATGFPLKIVRCLGPEEEIISLISILKTLEVEAFVIGGLLSEYQRTKFNIVGIEAGIPCYAPLWRKDQRMLLTEIVNHGFEFILCKVAAYGFKKADLAKKVDMAMVQRLAELAQKNGVSVGGEGGEYESLVTDAPFFTRRIVLEGIEVVFDNIRSTGKVIVRNVRTEKK